jgi:hypothetical protein
MLKIKDLSDLAPYSFIDGVLKPMLLILLIDSAGIFLVYLLSLIH